MLAPPAAVAQVTEATCGPIQNAIGPWDYRTERGNPLQLVESAHFTTSVEMAIAGKSGYLGQDLDYTLRAFPNHHRALIAVAKYGDRTKSLQPDRLPRTIECYYERALRFRPDDTVARMLYARFLNSKARQPEAIQQLTRVSAEAKDNAFTHYNVGLIYLEMGDHERALASAHQAYALGFTRPDLRDRLVSAGKWKDDSSLPPSTTNAASSASAPGAASASGR